MPSNPETTVAREANIFTSQLLAGIDTVPQLQAEVEDLKAQQQHIQAALETTTTALSKLQAPIDFDEPLQALEEQAVESGNVPLFVFARAARQPYFDAVGDGDEDRHKKRGREGQIDQIDHARILAATYDQLVTTLRDSSEPMPFMRYSGFSHNHFGERRWGSLRIGRLNAGAQIELEKTTITGTEKFPGHEPEKYSEVELVIQDVDFSGRVSWRNADDWMMMHDGWVFETDHDPVVYLLDGTPPTELPENARSPRPVISLDDIRSGASLLVGKEVCTEFLDDVYSHRWANQKMHDSRQDPKKVDLIREIINSSLTAEEIRERYRFGTL